MTRRLHCWQGKLDLVHDADGWDEYVRRKYGEEEPDGTCMLEHGHAGPHVFTPDAEIGVSFAEPPS